MKNIEVCEVDTREYISWKNGMFIFNEMTFGEYHGADATLVWA